MTRLRPYLTTIASIGIVFLYSCSDDVVSKGDDDYPPPPPPLEELPDIPCKTDLQYGYTDRTSYTPGTHVVAYLHGRTTVQECALVVNNIKGDSVLAVASSLQVQTISAHDPSKNGYNFIPSVDFKLPDNLPSGIYQIENSIPFIVKPTQPVDVLVVYPSNTVNAYSTSGGKSLYTADRPFEVSFHRPMAIQNFSSRCLNWLFSFPDVSIGYIADNDLDDYATMSAGKILCIVGHNEYWTRKARENFDKYVASGGHAVILSGNTMWWQVRYSDDDGQSRMICYKNDGDPFENPLYKTILWNDPSLQYSIISSIGADFDNGGYGLKPDNGWNGYKIASAQSPLLQGTGLVRGDVVHCPTSEYDGAPIAGWADGYPVLDTDKMGSFKAELVGFDYGFRVSQTVGTFIVVQPAQTSGIIVNTGSTDWCSTGGMGGASGDHIKKITSNALLKLLNHENLFSQ